MTTYRNPWHNPAHPNQGPRVYETDAQPIEYGGYLIYQRIPGVVWDVVRDGVCVTQRAGLSGAKSFIEEQVCRENSTK